MFKEYFTMALNVAQTTIIKDQNYPFYKDVLTDTHPKHAYRKLPLSDNIQSLSWLIVLEQSDRHNTVKMPFLASIRIVGQLHSEREQFDSLLLSMSLM